MRYKLKVAATSIFVVIAAAALIYLLWLGLWKVDKASIDRESQNKEGGRPAQIGLVAQANDQLDAFFNPDATLGAKENARSQACEFIARIDNNFLTDNLADFKSANC